MPEENVLTWHEAPMKLPVSVLLSASHNYYYQESSSWHESGSTDYHVIRVPNALIIFCEKYSFNNDGMNDEEREDYEGDHDNAVCPFTLHDVSQARQIIETHFKTDKWESPTIPEEEDEEESREEYVAQRLQEHPDEDPDGEDPSEAENGSENEEGADFEVDLSEYDPDDALHAEDEDE